MRQRSLYSIFVVPEPVVGNDTGVVRGVIDTAQRLDFTYPDGSHDAEGLAVTPGGAIYVLTKGWGGTSRGYIISRAAIERQGSDGVVLSASPVEGLTIETGSIPYMVTGAAVSPSGVSLVARTYLGFHFFDITQTDGAAVYSESCTIGYREPQGEAVDFWGESTLVVTSEALAGRPGTVHRVRCGGG